MDLELRLQQECFMWHWNKYPEQRGLLFKVKNEGRNKITGARDKASGLIPGVSDMVYLIPFSKPILIEFKTEAGKQSKKQKEWQSLVVGYGYLYKIIRNVETFQELCEISN